MSQVETRRVLVLGEKATAAGIVQSLRELGFETTTVEEALPALSDPQALERLRAILQRFAQEGSSVPGQVLCVHPGVSVWAERPELATLGEELDLEVICPPARVLALFANKLNLLGEADRLGIPHLAMGF